LSSTLADAAYDDGLINNNAEQQQQQQLTMALSPTTGIPSLLEDDQQQEDQESTTKEWSEDEVLLEDLRDSFVPDNVRDAVEEAMPTSRCDRIRIGRGIIRIDRG